MAKQEYEVQLQAQLTKGQLTKVLSGGFGPSGVASSETFVMIRYGWRSYKDLLDYDVWLAIDDTKLYASCRAGTQEQIEGVRRGLSEGASNAGVSARVEEV